MHSTHSISAAPLAPMRKPGFFKSLFRAILAADFAFRQKRALKRTPQHLLTDMGLTKDQIEDCFRPR